MTDIWVAPDTLFDGTSLVAGQAVRVVDGRVVEMGPSPAGAVPLDGCLTPGFVDLQVNGGGGVMLNSTPSRDGMAAIAAAHRSFGTVAVMPTVITDTVEVLDRAVDAAVAAKGDPGIVGLHIEGPHISVARRGTHNGADVRQMDDRTLDHVARLRQHGIAVMITVAPESTTFEQIEALAALGAIVSIGHTDAEASVVESAISAGATCATHLFNAMSPMTSRAPGAVGAIINSQIRAGIICDGFHVDDRMIQIALRARPLDDLMFLVSDAMATVGGPDHFDLYGQEVRLKQGRLINAEGGLAGAHFTQLEGVRRLVHHLGLSFAQALRMAISIPAELIGQDHLGRLEGQDACNVLHLSDEMSLVRTLEDVASALTPNAAE